jgi:DNA polymerase-1
VTPPLEKVLAALDAAGIAHDEPRAVAGHLEFRSGCPGDHATPNGREIKWTILGNGAVKMHHFGPGCRRADVLAALGLAAGDLGVSANGNRRKANRPGGDGGGRAGSEFFHPVDGLLAATLTKAVEDIGPISAADGGVLYHYRDGVWLPDGERVVRERVSGMLGELYRTVHASTVVDILRSREPWLHWAGLDTVYLNLPNGLLNWRTGQLHPHSPQVRSTVRIPVEWNPAATCPEISRWLGQVFPGDVIAFVEEVAGYTLYNDNPLHKAIMLFGRGRNGKSTFLHLLAALAGQDNLAAVSPQALDENRFMGAELYGKLANLAGDVDPRAFKATETFKKAVGGDWIHAERKHGQPFKFKSRAVMIAAFNALPRTFDTTEGFFSKWIVVPFHGYFPPGVADPDLLAKLTKPEELQGFLVLAVAGLRRLLKRGYFKLPPSVEKATVAFRYAADPVRAFLADRLKPAPDSWLPKPEIYEGYTRWTEETGHKPMASGRFYEQFEAAAEDAFGYPIATRIRKGTRGFLGVAWLGDEDGWAPQGDDEPDKPPVNGHTSSSQGAEGAEGAGSLTFTPARARVQEREIGKPAPSAPSAPRVHVGISPAEPVLITSVEDWRAVLPVLLEAPALGLDCETTGLDPFTSDVRLVQVADTSGRACVVDVQKVPPAELQPVLDRARLLIGHNLKFDLRHLMAAGLTLPRDIGGRVFDTMLASQVLWSGDRAKTHKLSDLTQRHLGVALDKTAQLSDWSSGLTDEQLAYAAADAAVLLPLREALAADLACTNLGAVARIEHHALPAIAWMEHAGLHFDRDRHEQLARDARKRVAEADRQLVQAAGRRMKWDSPNQVLDLLRSRGHRVDSTGDVVLAALAGTDEVAKLLQEYRVARKLVGLYGPEFARRVSPVTERIHPDFRQMGAASGRMSCGNPNVQQIPRASGHRRLFCAPEGRVLVWADYSQIELRIVAEISGDEELRKAFAAGEDIHATTSRLVGVPRSLAKNLNFGLVYGAGAARFAALSGLSEADAATFRGKFFRAYAGLRDWQKRQGGSDGPASTYTIAGRRRLNVARYTEKLNSPVQGTGADGLKTALGLAFEGDRPPSAVLVNAVHDELVAECDDSDAPATAEWLTGSMERGMSWLLKSIPVVAEASSGREWDR